MILAGLLFKNHPAIGANPDVPKDRLPQGGSNREHFNQENDMIPALQKEYYPETMPERDRWEEYERLKMDIIKQARTHEEYEELNRKLLDKLGL